MFEKEFINLWDTKVKQQVMKCSPEYINIRMLESEDISKEEKQKLVKEMNSKGYKDLLAQFYIGNLVWAVEHALADNREDLNFLNSFMQVRDCLNSESYWQNVFKGDEESEEAKNLKELAQMMNELYAYM